MPRFKNRKEIEDYLLGHIEKGGCWLWTGRVDRLGYGLLSVNGRTHRVARLAYKLWVGPIPKGFDDVHHTCEDPRCICPDHLLPLTHAAHIFLHALSGAWRGERNSQARLRDEEVRFIKVARGLLPAQTLALQFNVTERHIYYIWSEEAWRHVEEPEIPEWSEKVREHVRAKAKRGQATLESLQKLRRERGQPQPPDLEEAILYAKICAVL